MGDTTINIELSSSSRSPITTKNNSEISDPTNSNSPSTCYTPPLSSSSKQKHLLSPFTAYRKAMSEFYQTIDPKNSGMRLRQQNPQHQQSQKITSHAVSSPRRKTERNIMEIPSPQQMNLSDHDFKDS